MPPKLTLISHLLCPYVQRAVIILQEKQLPYERIDIDLSAKPDWFLRISPLGKTPVLLADEQAIFESSVICEYLDEITGERMHPAAPITRAQHRAWMEFASSSLNAIGAMYNAPDAQTLDAKAGELRAKFRQLEAALDRASHAGPYFSGDTFRMVDAAFAPVFRYFDTFDAIADFGIFNEAPRVKTWRSALQRRASVQNAVRSDYPNLLRDFLLRRESELSRLMRRQQLSVQ
ncbi:glutathione S-transferase family protein [Chromobacterium amazonense]|uniref:glutathione S-transferase family protein n=1 Tax=Chromobacterium amazonense TaxID=1382803 RepID=UPI003F793C37